MNESNHSQSDSIEPDISAVDCDGLEKLLARDARDFQTPIPSWFAARTAAVALQTSQKNTFDRLGLYRLLPSFSYQFRRGIPLPFAGLAMAGVCALSFLLIQHQELKPVANTSGSSLTSAASESEFEQHIELLADNSDYSQ